MKQHYESTRHCIAVGLGDLSFWCYECDSYLHHLKIRRIYYLYSQLHYAKFNEAVPVEFEGEGNDSDDDFKERGHESSDDDDSPHQASAISPPDQTVKSSQTNDTKKPPPSGNSSSSPPTS